MPYKSIDELPGPLKEKLPKHALEIYLAAFNSAFGQYEGDEKRSHGTAWAAVKTRYHRDDKGEWVETAEKADDDTGLLRRLVGLLRKAVGIEDVEKGGPGSGNWGHAGRPGAVGGSMPSGGIGGFGGGASMEGAAMSVRTGATAAQRQAEAARKKPSEAEVTLKVTGRGLGETNAPRDSDDLPDYSKVTRIDWGDKVPDRAKITFQQAYKLADERETRQERAWYGDAANARLSRPGRSGELADEAIATIRQDHTIRRWGRPITAKFPGADAVTGEKIAPGDAIIYNGPGQLVKA